MRYECTEGSHNKFWEYEGPHRDGPTWVVQITWGRIGSGGDTQEKSFGSLRGAEEFIAKKVNEKLGKGYREVAPSRSRPSSRMPNSMSEVWYDDGTGSTKKTVSKPASSSVKEDKGIDVIDFDFIAEAPAKEKAKAKT